MTRRTRSEAGQPSLADDLLRTPPGVPLPPISPPGPLPPLQAPPEARAAAVVAEIAGGMDDAIRGAARTSKPGVPLFATANSGVAGIAPDVAKIVEAVYAVDAWRDYEDLEANLEVGDQRGDYRTLTEHLDRAEKRARRAHALYLGAKLELVKWELDADAVTAKMREQASDALEAEKEKGDRTKRITNDDVESKIAELFSDEVRGQKVARAKLRGTVEHLERLADLWKTKCYSLSTMLANLRK